jgi:Fibronectin type III domain
MSSRTIRLLGIGTASAVAVLGLSALPASAQPTSPSRLQVDRAGSDSSDLNITWSAVPGVDHYTVNVFDGSVDRKRLVDAATTSFVYDGDPAGVCTRYQVYVTAVFPDGRSGRTGRYWVSQLAPGAASAMAWNNGTLSWGPGRFPGVGPVTDFSVKVKQLSTNATVVDTRTGSTSIALADLDPTRSYLASVQVNNAFGSCSTASVLINGSKAFTTAPRGLSATRDAVDPGRAVLSWNRPEWADSQGISGYRIFVRWVGHRTVEKIDVGPDELSYAMALDPNRNWTIQVKALVPGRMTRISKPITLSKLGALSRDMELDPAVSISQSASTVIVDVSGRIGSGRKYSRLDVRIAQTSGGTFTDDHQTTNGAQQITFGNLPAGTYTVVVTGQSSTASKEFGRTSIEVLA